MNEYSDALEEGKPIFSFPNNRSFSLSLNKIIIVHRSPSDGLLSFRMSEKRQEIVMVKGINKENSFTKFFDCSLSSTLDIRRNISQKFSVNIWNLL